MKTGATSLELDLTLEFHSDGTQSGLHSICLDGRELPEHVSTVLWRYLRDLAAADRIVEECWANAEDDGDQDAGCDDERMPGAAE